jgi:membrane-associated phospholipid phosphatase
MAADRHYITDVLAGGAAGALAGVFIPRLTGSLPGRATVIPQPGGLAISGRF